MVAILQVGLAAGESSAGPSPVKNVSHGEGIRALVRLFPVPVLRFQRPGFGAEPKREPER